MATGYKLHRPLNHSTTGKHGTTMLLPCVVDRGSTDRHYLGLVDVDE